MVNLITPDTIAFNAFVSEDELRERLAMEVLESINALDEHGKPAPGVTYKVLRGTGRNGGYSISVTGPAPARFNAPMIKGPDA